ncbi:heavy metal-associated isoprenylated plant protein 39-like [Tasmannia lanceolata]|uniref:heavy metal-associated isoprenylated plant protein 39-like n=1 Tax=Tasmannia lanceolata TaxID=3420 RepID=UPI0040643863
MSQKKVVIKITSMTDVKVKQKAIEAVTEIFGVDSIAADLKKQEMVIVGNMDPVAIAKKLKKIGKIDILSVGPAKAEKK